MVCSVCGMCVVRTCVVCGIVFVCFCVMCCIIVVCVRYISVVYGCLSLWRVCM